MADWKWRSPSSSSCSKPISTYGYPGGAGYNVAAARSFSDSDWGRGLYWLKMGKAEKGSPWMSYAVAMWCPAGFDNGDELRKERVHGKGFEQGRGLRAAGWWHGF